MRCLLPKALFQPQRHEAKHSCAALHCPLGPWLFMSAVKFWLFTPSCCQSNELTQGELLFLLPGQDPAFWAGLLLDLLWPPSPQMRPLTFFLL